MSSFDLAHWCDFVRGVADAEATEAMARELDTGSEEARRAVAAFRAVASVAEEDHTHRPPAYALRVAKAVASVQRTTDERSAGAALPSRLKSLAYDLVFDSLLTPRLAGTRNLESATRQVAYRFADYGLDVRLDHDAEPWWGTVAIGQVVRHGAGGSPVAGSPVFVLAKDKIVAWSKTSEHGEFMAEELPNESLRLCVLVSDGECLDVPLVGVERKEQES